MCTIVRSTRTQTQPSPACNHASTPNSPSLLSVIPPSCPYEGIFPHVNSQYLFSTSFSMSCFPRFIPASASARLSCSPCLPQLSPRPRRVLCRPHLYHRLPSDALLLLRCLFILPLMWFVVRSCGGFLVSCWLLGYLIRLAIVTSCSH